MHWLSTHISHLVYAAAGGLLTSTAELAFSYNLVDFLKDKIAGLFTKPAPVPSVKK
jgi:hypothetical protein